MNTKQIHGSALKVGDAIVVFSRAHRVTELKAYPKLSEICPGHSGRLVDCDDGFGITVFDGSLVSVAAGAQA